MRDPEDYAGTWVFLRRAKWKETFAILPHRCRISKRLIWFKKAYKGVATYTAPGPGTPVTETQWHETGEHIKWLLTRDNNETIASLIAQDLISVQPQNGLILKL